jgi:hypothetical protein
MRITDDLWHAMYEVGVEGSDVANIHPDLLDQLIEYRILERCDDGKLLLTRHGAACFYEVEAGREPRIPGIDIHRTA